MSLDIARDGATGLEDDENFYELVRQRAKLENATQARDLTFQILLRVLQQINDKVAIEVIKELPADSERFIYPKLGALPTKQLTVGILESELEVTWGTDLEQAARMLVAVGLSVADRLSEKTLVLMTKALPKDLAKIFPNRSGSLMMDSA